MIDPQAIMDAEELRHHAALMTLASPKARCANGVPQAKCALPTMGAHIFCKHHFLAYGGYDRYSCFAVKR
jgi:hypothetical protein